MFPLLPHLLFMNKSRTSPKTFSSPTLSLEKSNLHFFIMFPRAVAMARVIY